MLRSGEPLNSAAIGEEHPGFPRITGKASAKIPTGEGTAHALTVGTEFVGTEAPQAVRAVQCNECGCSGWKDAPQQCKTSVSLFHNEGKELTTTVSGGGAESMPVRDNDHPFSCPEKYRGLPRYGAV